MGQMLVSSISLVAGMVPVSLLMAALAEFALRHRKVRGGQVAFLLFVPGLTLPLEGVIVPIYYEMPDFGLLGSRSAMILPLTGLFMPFGVYWMPAHFVNALGPSVSWPTSSVGRTGRAKSPCWQAVWDRSIQARSSSWGTTTTVSWLFGGTGMAALAGS